MRMSSLRLVGASTIDLPIFGANPSDIFVCKSVEGLGPPDVDVSIARTVFAGGVYQGRRPLAREIIVKIALNPAYYTGQTVADLRDTLYGLLTPGVNDIIDIQIMDGATIVAQTQGYASKFETVIFEKEPAVAITLSCIKSYLEAPALVNPNLFSTPFRAVPVITNVGTAPSGIHGEIVFSAGGSKWTLTRGSQKMEFNFGFLSGGRLVFDTRPGYRAISYTYAGITSNMLNSLSNDSVWFELHRGVNTFAATPITYDWASVYYRPQYWGI